MKRNYLSVTVLKKNGSSYENPLKLSEAYLINKILKLEGVSSVNVEMVECDVDHYRMLFNK